MKTEYNTVTVEAADGGWIIRQKGEPTRITCRWVIVMSILEMSLTSKGDGK